MPPYRQRFGLAANRRSNRPAPFSTWRTMFFPFTSRPPPNRRQVEHSVRGYPEWYQNRMISASEAHRRPHERRALANVLTRLRTRRHRSGRQNIPDNVARHIASFL